MGARGTLAGGVDAWTGGGGAAMLGRIDLGAASASGQWSESVRYGGWTQLVGGWVFDGHAVTLGLDHRSGLGLALLGSASASVGWAEAALAASGDTRAGPLRLDATLGPAVRFGAASIGAGAEATLGAEVPGERLSPRIDLGGTAWGAGPLPHVGRASASIRAVLVRALAVAPYASLLATAGGDGSAAGLPAGGSWIGRAGLSAELAFGSAVRLSADAAAELGPGYQRGVALAGIGAGLGRLRARGCAAIGAGATRFRLRAPAARQVALLGSFTDWTALPMEREGASWVATVPLPEGTHEYVYLVDGEPVVPPEAALTRPDPFGGTNGVLQVGPAGAPCG